MMNNSRQSSIAGSFGFRLVVSGWFGGFDCRYVEGFNGGSRNRWEVLLSALVSKAEGRQ